ncbi:MAG: hypothetical protein RRY65_06720 [Pseudoflavonifractor sp.]
MTTTTPETTTLAGTEKQIAWAADLRAGAIASFRWAAANPSGAALAEPEKFAANIEKFIARIQSVKSAHQLIETFKHVDFGEKNQMTLLNAVLHAMDGKLSPKYF